MPNLFETIAVQLTAAELLLLRQRLASGGPGTPAVDSALDAKLYEAQRRLEESSAETDRIAEAMRQAKANPGEVVTVDGEG